MTEAGETFALQSARVLRIELTGGAWIKPGTALAYRGDVSFERRPTIEADSVADAVLRELVPLVRVSGNACVYCGWHGRHIQLVRLAGERIVVAADELLAFEDGLAFWPRLVKNKIGVAAGGLLAVTFEGSGSIAIGLHGEALTLPVTSEALLCTDPLATVAWSADLEPTLRTDVTWRAFVGHGGSEPVQMCFQGTGHVLVQPFKDERRWHPEHVLAGALKSLVPVP